MKKKMYDTINENVYQSRLPNGLDVYLLPKQDISKTYAIFMTNYGSIDCRFTPIGQEEAITVPDGIAHFLEHKLFEKEDRDVFQDFLAKGASPNAFTSFTKTAYLFSTTKETNANVNTLLDFVQSPYFSDQSVEKEKGIIGQEIKMYDDQPDWKSFMGSINNMFHEHPVKIDIAGTVDSIAPITKEDLYTCYNTFYHPENMVLVVAGNFDAEEMIDTISANQSKKEFPDYTGIDRKYPEESTSVAKKETVLEMPVTVPKVTIGIKEEGNVMSGEEFLEREVLQSMLLDYFLAPSGPYYEALYDEALIDDSFDYSNNAEQAFSFSLIATNTKKPEQTAEALKKVLKNISKEPLTEATLETMKKKQIGHILRAMNSIEYIAGEIAHYHFLGLDFFEVIPYIQSVTLEQVNKFLTDWIKDDALTVTIVKPSQQEDA